MAVPEIKDVERGEIVSRVEGLGNPLLKKVADQDDVEESEINESYFMVLFSTFVAVCGSFEFGSCVSFSQKEITLYQSEVSFIRQNLCPNTKLISVKTKLFIDEGWILSSYSIIYKTRPQSLPC